MVVVVVVCGWFFLSFFGWFFLVARAISSSQRQSTSPNPSTELEETLSPPVQFCCFTFQDLDSGGRSSQAKQRRLRGEENKEDKR